MKTWDVFKDKCQISKDIVDNYRTMFETRISMRGTEKLPCLENLCISSWSYDVEGHAKKCVERYCELANRRTQQLYKVSTPCIDDHHFKEEELKSVGDLPKVCSQIVLKCLCLARIGRPHIFYGQCTNLHERSQNGPEHVTNDWIVWYLTSITHVNTNSIVLRVMLQNNAGWDCFQDSEFAGDLEDSKSTSGGALCVFGSHTFVPISWMCKKRTSVSHSSTESEIISLDEGLRLDGNPALDLWDLIVAVLGNTDQSHKERRDPFMNKREVRSTPQTKQKRKQSHGDQDDWKGKKSHNETCFQNPKSCSWLVMRLNQFGPQNPNQVHWHQKPTRRHAHQGKFHTWWMESSFVC